MAIAIVAALAIREIFTALVITLFVLVAEILEGLTVSCGRTAIRHLVGLLPMTATARRNESWQDFETDEIAVGEIVLVKPGARPRRRGRERPSMPERLLSPACSE